LPKYTPGSFSKNFAWHGTGLLKLHTAIRDGFDGELISVTRRHFRERCTVLTDDIQLIPLNFFLHNTLYGRENWVSVDELVYAAVSRIQSQLFDRLALFSLHINLAGDRMGKNGEAQPAIWIKEFVVNRFWRADAWRPDATSIEEMDAFFKENLRAKSEVRIKCRSNYRYLLQQCGYLVSAIDAIDSGCEQWIVSAIYLTWDRFLLDKSIALTSSRNEFIDRLIELDVHKLAGTSEGYVRECANEIVDDYIATNGIERLKIVPQISPIRRLVSDHKNADDHDHASQRSRVDSVLSGESSEDLELNYSVGEEVRRRLRAVETQLRNSTHIRKLKRLYGNKCQICGERVQTETSPDRYYSEGAHIKPVGKPHNGPDTPANILILCPNHHVELDSGMITLHPKDSEYVVESRNLKHPFFGVLVSVLKQHKLDADLISWHRDYFSGRRRTRGGN
jgi:hypothetical protein